jgi:hypothetical protein
MRERQIRYFVLTATIFGTAMCRKAYDPPAIKASNHFLAIDGVINTGKNSTTTFRLSRSVSLADTLPYIPELNAQVLIQTVNGPAYPLKDTGTNGIYVSEPLTLDPTQQYQLSVTASDGNKYLSDAVTPKPSPAIDSITWGTVDDPITDAQAIQVFVNSHDPTNNTRYYRWDYLETWQHHAHFQSYWGISDGLVYPVTDEQGTYSCWSTASSNTILLGTSITLAADVINHIQIASFAQNDPRLDVEYSMLVRQYPLDLNAYNYWLTIQKNSQTLGGLFDIQPSQITGNIHAVSNPNSPVLGYVSASSIQEQRIFIPNPGWRSNPPIDCPINVIESDPDNSLVWNYPDTSFGIWYFNTGNPPTINITYKDCVDCRYQGGTTVKPSFWQ